MTDARTDGLTDEQARIPSWYSSRSAPRRRRRSAIEGMQREYIQRSREDGTFVDWL